MADANGWVPSSAPGGWTKRKFGAFTVYASAAQHRTTIYAAGEIIHEAYIGVADQISAQREALEELRKLLTSALGAAEKERGE